MHTSLEDKRFSIVYGFWGWRRRWWKGVYEVTLCVRTGPFCSGLHPYFSKASRVCDSSWLASLRRAVRAFHTPITHQYSVQNAPQDKSWLSRSCFNDSNKNKFSSHVCSSKKPNKQTTCRDGTQTVFLNKRKQTKTKTKKQTLYFWCGNTDPFSPPHLQLKCSRHKGDISFCVGKAQAHYPMAACAVSAVSFSLLRANL
jgi:hypothetical protein